MNVSNGNLEFGNKSIRFLFLAIACYFYCSSFFLSSANAVVYPKVVKLVDYNDKNWVHGLLKLDSDLYKSVAELKNNGTTQRTGFLVDRTPENSVYFKINKNIVFSNKEKRKILAVVPNGVYFTIVIEGSTLENKNVGFPNNIDVVD